MDENSFSNDLINTIKNLYADITVYTESVRIRNTTPTTIKQKKK